MNKKNKNKTSEVSSKRKLAVKRKTVVALAAVKSVAKDKGVLKAKAVKTEKKNRFFYAAKIGLKVILYSAGVLLGALALVFIYVNLPVKANSRDIPLGVTFSIRYANDIGLDWREAYMAMLDELEMKRIRIPIYWDSVEKTEGQYDFTDLDWQLEQAQKHGAKVILVIGKKVPRWPECYVPDWVGTDLNNLDEERLKEKLLAFETVVVNRYKSNHPELENWQVENEPFLDFGICGTIDPVLLDAEIANVKKLDPAHPVMVTDSGELSVWVNAAKRADVFGTTMYREVYSAKLGHWRYPIGPNFFKLKKLLISVFADQKNAVVIELQGEPWVQGWTTNAPVETQLASMNAEVLKDNVEFAKKTDFDEIYVWGVEWWYWMKVSQNNPTLWEQAKDIYVKK